MKYLQKPYLIILTLLSYNLSFAEEIQSLDNDLDMTDDAPPLNRNIDITDWILPASTITHVTLITLSTVLGFLYIKSKNKVADLNSKIENLETDLSNQAQWLQSKIEEIEHLQSEILKLRSTVNQTNVPESLKILTDDLFNEFGISAIIKYVKSHIEYHGLKLPDEIKSIDALDQYIQDLFSPLLPKNDLIILSENDDIPPLFSDNFKKFIAILGVEKAYLLERSFLFYLADEIGMSTDDVKQYIIDKIDSILGSTITQILKEVSEHNQTHGTNHKASTDWILGDESLTGRLNQEDLNLTE